MHGSLRQNKGITLIELLVALVIAGILVAAVYRTFLSQQKTYTVQEQVVDMQQNVRALINRMMREIRMAGFGNVSMLLPPPYGLGPGVTIGGKNYTDVVNPDYPVAGSVTILSGICFYYINGSGEKVVVSTTEVPVVPNQIKVNSLTDTQGNVLFDTGDRKYVSIGGVESYTITNIVGTTLTLSGNLTYSHPVNTPVFAIRAISYQVGIVDGKPTLLRDENTGAGGQSLADNIETLQFGYLDANGNPTANPPGIRIVQVTLRATTNDSDPEYKSDGGYRKRTIASNVRLRNMGLEL
jgi:prepilin-type N-terminal cleavage/methylation domain-containing protein